MYPNRLTMKKLFTLLVALLPLGSLIAQTYLSQDFGKSKKEVLKFLHSKSIATNSDATDAKVIASTDAYTVTYYFDENGLYKMETVSHFDKKKSAESQVDLLKTQFELQKAEIVELDNNQEVQRFAALKGRELHEVTAFSLGKNCTQIKSVSMNLDLMPGADIASLRQDNLLFSMIR